VKRLDPEIVPGGESVAGAIRGKCPVCLEYRAYLVSTEVFLAVPILT
jgi:hypothetical protein